MVAPVNIKDAKTGNAATVTRFGQLVTAPLDYSTPVAREILTINEAVNFLVPEAGQNIVITDIIVSADKDVSNTTPANVTIYQATAPDELTEEQVVVEPQLLRGSNFILTGLNWFIPEGFWLNAKTDDAGVLITIAAYRVPIERG
jgi:hypothetical protein